MIVIYRLASDRGKCQRKMYDFAAELVHKEESIWEPDGIAFPDIWLASTENMIEYRKISALRDGMDIPKKYKRLLKIIVYEIFGIPYAGRHWGSYPCRFSG